MVRRGEAEKKRRQEGRKPIIRDGGAHRQLVIGDRLYMLSGARRRRWAVEGRRAGRGAPASYYREPGAAAVPRQPVQSPPSPLHALVAVSSRYTDPYAWMRGMVEKQMVVSASCWSSIGFSSSSRLRKQTAHPTPRRASESYPTAYLNRSCRAARGP